MAVKKYVVAVSGGVDSVVLLDILRRLPDIDLVVAHFDHGIRSDSAEDAAFVEQLARKYDLPFEGKREELGRAASEDQARQRRYAFLRDVAQRHNASLVTAHHKDDLVETVALNHARGTGWRGLAPMQSDVIRPLLSMDKQSIIDYATKHGLRWHEDSTNSSPAYTRNRLRMQLKALPASDKQTIAALVVRQRHVRRAIEQEVSRLLPVVAGAQSRYFFIMIPEQPALELLRHLSRGRLTRPQLQRAWLAIKTAKPGALHQAGAGVEFHFTSRHFTVELVK